MNERLRKKRVSCLGHSDHRENDCSSKKLLTFEVEGTQPRGTPKKRRMNNINHGLKTIKPNQH